MDWKTNGFEGFLKGQMGNGGQNIYVSAKGVLQRIFQFDVNNDGYPDLLFANSQSMFERPPVYVYTDPINGVRRELPTYGTYDGTLADLNGDGYDDLVLACQNDGTHCDLTAIIYYGSEEGLTERYKVELPVPNSTGVVAGDFNGDGYPDLVFISGRNLRAFYGEKEGIVPFSYIDIPVPVKTMAASDLDGDGYCDIFFNTTDGSCGILWGGPSGISVDAIQWIHKSEHIDLQSGGGSTANREDIYRGWKASVVMIDGMRRLFVVKEGEVGFYGVDSHRTVTETFHLHCQNAIAAVAGKLLGRPFDDLVIAVSENPDITAKSFLLPGSVNGFCEGNRIDIDTISAQNLTLIPMEDTKKCRLLICQGSRSETFNVISKIYEFEEDGTARQVAKLECGDPMRALVGWPAGKKQSAQVVMLNHAFNRPQGLEKPYIYLGGEDGYNENRRLEFRGHSSVDGAICDFNDDGIPDVIICNCAEDATQLDIGSEIFFGSENGFSLDNSMRIPSVRGHGVAIGDFRKSGYLDIAVGGFNNREIRIFRGGPDGYQAERYDSVIFGPNSEGYVPPAYIDKTVKKNLSKEERILNDEYGQVRWLLAADFDGDGWEDLFVSQITGSHCYILWGGPEGFSTKRMSMLATDGVASAAAADLNRDGYLDLILAGHMSIGKKTIYDSYITVYWGGPDGYQEHRKMQLPAHCANSVTVGDYSGSGRLDIYATSYNDGRCRDLLSFLYKADENGMYSINNREYLFNHSGSGCISGDFNGDGYTDLAVACHKEYGNHCSHSFVFWGGPDGLNDQRKTVLPTIGPHGMCTVDPGNIMDRSDSEFYYSEIREIKKDAKVVSAKWGGTCTSTSWVRLYLRRGESEEALQKQPWLPVNKDGGIEGLEENGAFLQFRLELGAKCGCGTPRVDEVIITYD